MAKTAAKPKSITDAAAEVKKGVLQPIYLLFGQDTYTINKFVEQLQKLVEKQIESDFDREVYYASQTGIRDILSSAQAYPFGGGKKYILVKEFDAIPDAERMLLLTYAENPSPETVLALIYTGDKKDAEKGSLKKAVEAGILYEAKESYSSQLIPWIEEFVTGKGKQISRQDAQLLLDITGNDKTLLGNQLEKMITFLKDETQITSDLVQLLSDRTKEYTVFDLYRAIAKKEKKNAFLIMDFLITQAGSILPTLFMLNRYFFNLALIPLMQKEDYSEDAIARKIGANKYFLDEYRMAVRQFSPQDLYRITEALYQTELRVKTSADDEKTLGIMLLTEIFRGK